MTEAHCWPSRMRPLWALLAALVVLLSACSGVQAMRFCRR